MFVVAGASGRTGSVVARRLLAQGERVRVLLREHSSRKREGELWRERGAEVRSVDLADVHALHDALRGARAFYTLVPEDLTVPAFRARRRAIVHSVVEAVRLAAVPQVVLLSASAACFQEKNGLAQELCLAERGLAEVTRLISLRASYFQENVLSAIPLVVSRGVYMNFFPTPSFAVPMIATPDVGAAAARFMMETFEENIVIDLLGPSYSAEHVAHALGEALRKKPPKVCTVPADEQSQVLRSAGLPHEFAEALAELHVCLGTNGMRRLGARQLACATTLERTLRGVSAHHGTPEVPRFWAEQDTEETQP